MPNRTDSALSHVMGAAKKLKVTVKGLVGVFRTIAKQHGEVAALLERAKSSDEKFTELWPTIRRELLSHERAELREIYPVLRGNPATRALADHHDAEAEELEQLIAQIDGFAVASPQRRDMYQRLVDRVVHHASEEEGRIFPEAQDALGKEVIEALDRPFLATKETVAATL